MKFIAFMCDVCSSTYTSDGIAIAVGQKDNAIHICRDCRDNFVDHEAGHEFNNLIEVLSGIMDKRYDVP